MSPTGRVDYAAIKAPRFPQINLLPPEVTAGRSRGVLKQRLGIGLIGVLVFAVVGTVLSGLAEQNAASELALKQAETRSLTAEQAKYQEVPRLKAEIAAIGTAREAGMSTEVVWKDYLLAIEAVLPKDVSFDELTTQMADPMVPGAVPDNVLAGPSVGQISFTARVLKVPKVADWSDGLDSIPGFSDAFVQSVQISQDTGSVFYQVSATVNVQASVFAQRFVQKAGK